MNVEYRIQQGEGPVQVFSLNLNSRSLDVAQPALPSLPKWTALDFHKCPNCPLHSGSHPRCPLATQLVPLVNYGNRIASHAAVHVEVRTEARTITKDTTAQVALSSLMGLITATSGCPHARFLRPMARFHLPFSDGSETLYRVVSMYLLAQYFHAQSGGAPDLELKGLEERYKDIHSVNLYLARRLRAISEEDSAVNALTKLDSYSVLLPRKIKASLQDIAHLFRSN